ESFESQNFTALPWGFNDDAPWVITSTASAGNFGAASGKIGDGQNSGLSIDVTTGGGYLTFARQTSTEGPSANKTGDELRLYIDGRIALYTAVDGVALATPAAARWSGDQGYAVITVPIAAGHHNF